VISLGTRALADGNAEHREAPRAHTGAERAGLPPQGGYVVDRIGSPSTVSM
jgi:hypothetical protein